MKNIATKGNVLKATLQGLLEEVVPQDADSPSSSCKRADTCLQSLLGAEAPSLFVEPESLLTPYAGYGVKSAQGMSKHMEDSYSVQTKLSSPGIDTSSLVSLTTANDEEISLPGFSEDLAFFSVFDGHGGDEVAQHCSDRLHKHFTQQLVAALQSTPPAELAAVCASQPSCTDAATSSDLAGSSSASTCSGADMPMAGSGTEPNVADETADVSVTDSETMLSLSHAASIMPTLIKDALRTSFLQTDAELAGTEAGEFVGATAVVAIIAKQHIWVAHAGDSRAVISRSGDACALTSDHKPDRPDEAARVRAVGGRIVHNGGARRVMGMLAMTRSIGDHYLRPYIVAEPDITVVERGADDEVLILATDGLWDMFSVTEATALANRCISRSTDRGMSRHGACRVAATVLAKAAIDRGSRDNITVIVVDISPESDEDNLGEADASGAVGAAPASGERATMSLRRSADVPSSALTPELQPVPEYSSRSKYLLLKSNKSDPSKQGESLRKSGEHMLPCAWPKAEGSTTPLVSPAPSVARPAEACVCAPRPAPHATSTAGGPKPAAARALPPMPEEDEACTLSSEGGLSLSGSQSATAEQVAEAAYGALEMLGLNMEMLGLNMPESGVAPRPGTGPAADVAATAAVASAAAAAVASAPAAAVAVETAAAAAAGTTRHSLRSVPPQQGTSYAEPNACKSPHGDGAECEVACGSSLEGASCGSSIASASDRTSQGEPPSSCSFTEDDPTRLTGQAQGQLRGRGHGGDSDSSGEGGGGSGGSGSDQASGAALIEGQGYVQHPPGGGHILPCM